MKDILIGALGLHFLIGLVVFIKLVIEQGYKVNYSPKELIPAFFKMVLFGTIFLILED